MLPVIGSTSSATGSPTASTAPTSERNTTMPAAGALTVCDPASGVAAHAGGGSAVGPPASTPACCRKPHIAAASSAAKVWLTSASPRSSIVALAQACGIGGLAASGPAATASLRASCHHRPDRHSSNDDAPEFDASKAARTCISRASGSICGQQASSL